MKARGGFELKPTTNSQLGSRATTALGRPSVLIAAVPISIVLITYLFWYSTWFGRRPNDREMSEYLTDTSVPHKTQHALSVLADEMARGDSSARRWYPDVLKLAGNPEPGIRQMAAWVMGEDNQNSQFHQVLRRLLSDPAVMVRWNAALALVRFRDATGEPELLEMLRPFELTAPASGRITLRARPGDAVSPSSLVARIAAGNQTVDVRSPLAGQLANFGPAEGAALEAGQPVASITPGSQQAWESLRALYLIGKPADLPDVDRYAHDTTGVPDRVREQARIAGEAIRGRVESSAGASGSASGGQDARTR